jgi:hypothetical protein
MCGRKQVPKVMSVELRCTAHEEFDSNKSRIGGVGWVGKGRLIRIGEKSMAEPVKLGTSAQQQPDPDEKLVKVFGSEQESEAMVVKGLLDTAGIDSDLTSAAFLQDMFPGLGGMIILVREEDADEARRLIAEQRQSPVAEDDETAEIEAYQDPVSGEPPAKA